ncbi:MAG: hypothetical protein HY704_16970, partial [Gemmatimonadetes bacterium]|nr:hypothetical protein [Gemmatimonadota bacterium]
SNHNSVFYATPAVATRTKATSSFYSQLTGSPFIVTAASLVFGGLNDINFNWRPPHQTHGIGTDVDMDGPADNWRVWQKLIRAGVRGGGFKKCEVHFQNHVHCYALLY